MPRIQYRTKRMGAERLAMIEHANKILAEYAQQGFDLTLRQLYYQFVARDLVPNTVQSYKRLGDIVDDGRMCGMIDWLRIEDRTRNLQELSHWNTPAGMIDSAFQSYRVDRWANQPVRLEVWCEKEALIGIFARVCEQYDVPYFACRGYVSQSEMWRAARRLAGCARRNQTPVILHFGDHDPSGIDMTRDIAARLSTFEMPTEVKRLALNMDQVEEHRPPPNPAKQTDARFQGYVVQYGDESWELDAMSPAALTGLVERAVREHRDDELWRETALREVDERARLKTLSENWQDISQHLDDEYEHELTEDRNELANSDRYTAETDAES